MFCFGSTYVVVPSSKTCETLCAAGPRRFQKWNAGACTVFGGGAAQPARATAATLNMSKDLRIS
ncbi:hypothetical protein GALL_535710 [mine drainage metagenome]|uniref:Uncharacterized protein n=1 Tax=mine drainage metagenome TaxID=410659 RepID=A0A1J5PBL4_9ZZZZ